MGIRSHKAIVKEVAESVSHWMEYAKDCGVRTDHAYIIGKNLLLFGKRLHTVNMPDIAHEQEQLFINAIQKDDFNAILELKMKGYQPSKNLLKSLQPEISSNTFIAIAKIFEMDEMLKDIKDINLSQTPSQTNGKNEMQLGNA